jgi:hypothetical protein
MTCNEWTKFSQSRDIDTLSYQIGHQFVSSGTLDLLFAVHKLILKVILRFGLLGESQSSKLGDVRIVCSHQSLLPVVLFTARLALRHNHITYMYVRQQRHHIALPLRPSYRGRRH